MRVLKSARIVFDGGYTTYDCRVKNLSSAGALLLLPSVLGIPKHFSIEIDKSGTLRPCTVMWRTDTQLGVAFDDARDATPPDRARPQLRLVELADKDHEPTGTPTEPVARAAG